MNTMKKVNIKPADKILNLEKYIFAELDEWKKEARENGADLIDLSIGNPDSPTPKPIVDAAVKSCKNPKSHGYPCLKGKDELQKSILNWMERRYDVKLDSEFVAQPTSGGKEALAYIAFAFTNPGDVNIVPDPYYPILSRGTWLSGGQVHHLPLSAENDFLPDLDSIPEEIARKAKIFFINYPNNPTAAIAPRWFLEKMVKFCSEHDILLVSDLAYGEICYDDYRPISIFSIEGAKDVAVEVHTFSKTFNMAGWRGGFIVGKKELVDSIHAFKTNMDYGTSTVIQDAMISALNMPYKFVEKTVKKYEKRRDFLLPIVNKMGWKVKKSSATMYFWLKVPYGMKSKEFCKMVMDKTGVVFTPGIAFGNNSDNYFRLSLVQPEKKLKEAFERLEEAGIKFEE